ncbi:FecR domain-containing protein [Pseudothauera lacus]|uniref:FecR domain-containing protein n=1 Tax=Pseudothauera lacus TaxID=2136175 RepID=UPI001C628CB9|nr:FecR domain-containing protein [Pseudothauera lacus]
MATDGGPALAQPPLAVLQQAAEWFAVLADPPVADRDQQAWQAWLAADPLHSAAWQRVEAVSRRFHDVHDDTPASAARAALSSARNTRRRTLGMLGGSLGMLLAGGLGLRHFADTAALTTLAIWAAGQRTATGEVREIALADGGRLWLNTASAADIDYSAGLRRIALHAGELLIATAPDPLTPPRPLVVDTRMGRLTALGTRFSVLLDGGACVLTVFEGAVRISPQAGIAEIIHSGHQARFTRHGVAATGAAMRARESWTQGLLLAEDRRLDDFVAELQRHVPVRLEVAAEVAALRLVGVYPLHEPRRDLPRVLGALQASLPVRTHIVDSRHLRIEAR